MMTTTIIILVLVLQVQKGSIAIMDIIQQHGIPNFYSCLLSSSAANKCRRYNATQDIKDPQNCYETMIEVVQVLQTLQQQQNMHRPYCLHQNKY
jgi:hypothetical protein